MCLQKSNAVRNYPDPCRKILMQSTWRLSARRINANRLLQSEFQKGLARNFHLLAFGYDLHGRPRSAARRRANCRAFAAARDTADDGSKHRTAANFLCRVAAATLALHVVVAADQRIVV